MRNRTRIFVFGLVALLGIASAIKVIDWEPRSQGRNLGSWLRELSFHVANENRAPAYEAIRHIGTNALPYLLKYMREKDSATRRKMMEWNEWFSERFNRDLFHFTPAEGYRSGATQAIGVLGAQAVSAIPELVANLSDPELAGDSALALSLIGDSALPAILQAAHSPEWCVRWSVAVALEGFTNQRPEIVTTLLSLTSDSQSEVRQSAAESIGNLRQQPELSVPILGRMLSDTNPSVRASVCQSLVNFGTNACFATFALSNATADATLLPMVVQALRQIGLAAMPTVLGLLLHPDDKVRVEGIGLVGGLRRFGTNCVTALLPLLHDPKAKVRERAATTIGSFRLAATNYVSALLPLLQDSDRDVRIHAIMSLRIIPSDPKSYVPIMVEAFKQEEDEIVCGSFLVAFQQFGEDAKAAVPMLMEMIRKQKEHERISILVPLAAIDAEAARSLGAEDLLLEIARTNSARLRAVFRPTINSVVEP